MTRSDPVHAVEQELAVLFRRARALSGSFAREVHPEVGAAAYGILLYLQQTEGTRLTDLATYLGVGKPTLSRQVRMLEEYGLVERVGDIEDARAVTLRLTEDGRSRIDAAREARRARFRELLRTWPQKDVDQLAALLHRFNDLQP